MRYFILLLSLLLHVYTIHAQSTNVYISVAMPSNLTLDNNAKSILKNKLLHIISIQGVAGTECGAIIISPEVDVVNSNIIGGGMRQIISVELGIAVTIRNMITNTVFNTIQISVTGEGYSDDEAKRSAINKINVYSPEYVNFVEVAKLKISDYYEINTAAIIAKANTLASQQLFDEALALLATYPEALSNYAQVANTMTSIFRKCQTQYCSQILLSAQAAYSQRNYNEAAELLTMIDAQSSCASQAKALLSTIKKDMDRQYNDMLIIEEKRNKSNERIKSLQIKAVRDIATAYFQRQTEYIFFR